MSAAKRNKPHLGNLNEGQASQLLALGIAGPRRPVDDVIDRLAHPDGAAWFATAVFPLKRLASALTRREAARPALDELIVLKEKAKAALVDAATRDEASAATALYFVAVATARVLHDAAISNQPSHEFAGVMADLAGAAPDPWAEILMEAALRID